jgi:hypothetical protein
VALAGARGRHARACSLEAHVVIELRERGEDTFHHAA